MPGMFGGGGMSTSDISGLANQEAQLNGSFGEGHVVAVALTGFAIEPTTLVQVDVLYEEGSYW